MRKERRELKIADIELNKGQLDWLPQNPRQWTKADIERTAKSIEEDPDFLEDRPLLVVAFGKKYVVFGGNLRREGCKKLGKATAPAVEYFPETEADYQTVIRRSLKDNGSFGAWDNDILANEYDDLPLEDYGLKVWDDKTEAQKQMENGGLSTAGAEGDDEYNEFVDKFKQKLTTDDCYTPPAVYDAVRDFVDKRITPLEGRKVIRPFFPGGDYENLKQYPKDCIVIDNPPFSILSKILRFYCENGIRFFLFAPELTLFSAADCDLTYINAAGHVVYENGADVRTGFITNLIEDLRVWCCPELGQMLDEAQPKEDKTHKGYVYPDNIITAAILGKITERDVELKIRKRSCQYIRESDSAVEQGRSLFGGGFLLSERAAAERAAAERAAAERAAATKLLLSDREKAIIERLNEQDKETDQKNV